MAHDIEITDKGASFFSANTNAWHNLGQVVEGAQTWEEAIKLAQMDWEVEKKAIVNPYTGEDIGHFGIYRLDNHHCLGVVGERYEPMQNAMMFSFMDAVLDADGEAHYETAGVLGNGERIFMTANLGKEHDILGSGDIHKAYFVGCGSHDGSISTEFFVSETRVVCNNTLQIARKGSATKVKVKRTINAEARLDAKLRDLQGARHLFNSTMEKLEFLATKKIDTAVVDRVILASFGDGKQTTVDQLSSRAKGSVEFVKMLLENNDDNAFPEFRGTAYNLLNAFTEFSDHQREVRVTAGRDGQSMDKLRSESSIFGSGAQFKDKVLDIILAEAETLASTNSSRSYSLGGSDAQILDAILSR